MARTLVLNATYEPICVVPCPRALVLVLSEKAETIASDGPDDPFRAPGARGAFGGAPCAVRACPVSTATCAQPSRAYSYATVTSVNTAARRPRASTTSCPAVAAASTSGTTSSPRVVAATHKSATVSCTTRPCDCGANHRHRISRRGSCCTTARSRPHGLHSCRTSSSVARDVVSASRWAVGDRSAIAVRASGARCRPIGRKRAKSADIRPDCTGDRSR